MEYRNKVDGYCKLFKAVSWRDELYKPGGKSRI
jgi:hypothetical protein